VGVVKDLGVGFMLQRGRAAGLYFPAAPSSGTPVNMIVHVKGDPLSMAPAVRTIANAADVNIRLSGFSRLDKVSDDVLWILGMWLRVTAVLTGIALLLSLAGIYAVLSFTVSRRTREIGVRVALGASRRRVVTAIFRRPLTQVGVGVMLGGILIGILALLTSIPPDSNAETAIASAFASVEGLSARQVLMVVFYAALMMGVCLLACIVPTRRALQIEPMQALRAE
jgi:ABC-type antimicrobial peptide transport system permease subunit